MKKKKKSILQVKSRTSHLKQWHIWIPNYQNKHCRDQSPIPMKSASVEGAEKCTWPIFGLKVYHGLYSDASDT